jgi:hypothetical protein
MPSSIIDRAPTLVLLGGLKDEMDGPGEVSCLRQMLGSTQQHCRMAVMAAGMHTAALVRGMRKTVLFFDMQGIHIGAQRYCAATGH